MISAGTQLGSYKILSLIGSGGMGEVYRAQDLRLGREVAIKVLPGELAADSVALARFEREVRAVAALSHSNILAIHEFDEFQGTRFAVMELLEGETLRVRISAGTLPWRKAVEIAIAIAEGLSAAHSKEIIHRDLKPENVFLTRSGQVKILDFGLARVKPPVATHLDTTAETSGKETESGTMIGTVAYMSPEQVKGVKADERSDIFSLGCILFELLNGRRPFFRTTAWETAAAIARESPEEFTESAARGPQELQKIVYHCLEKNPDERFQSARDLAFALKSVLDNSTGSSSNRTQPLLRGRI
ncbi:MAG TPA: serine/threonine-protein kinase, partial [Acidobacteriota bacterium]|nr:serine/threonine-protein kinase [Acidobacteriota bacterium]